MTLKVRIKITLKKINLTSIAQEAMKELFLKIQVRLKVVDVSSRYYDENRHVDQATTLY